MARLMAHSTFVFVRRCWGWCSYEGPVDEMLCFLVASSLWTSGRVGRTNADSEVITGTGRIAPMRWGPDAMLSEADKCKSNSASAA